MSTTNTSSNSSNATLNGTNNIVVDDIQLKTIDGLITAVEVECLHNIHGNIQEQLDNLQATGIANFFIDKVAALPSSSPPYVTLKSNGGLSFGIPAGLNGISPFFNIASVTTLDPGANSYIYLSGSNTDIGLNFGIVKGDPGISPPQIVIGNVK